MWGSPLPHKRNGGWLIPNQMMQFMLIVTLLYSRYLVANLYNTAGWFRSRVRPVAATGLRNERNSPPEMVEMFGGGPL